MAVQVCTILFKQRMGQAIGLLGTLNQHHPGSTLWVLQLDGEEQEKSGVYPNLKLLTPKEIGIHNYKPLAFELGITPLTEYLKPKIMHYLLTAMQLDHVLFIDSCLRIDKPLYPLLEMMDQHAAVLVTHPRQSLFAMIGFSNQARSREFISSWNHAVDDVLMSQGTRQIDKTEQLIQTPLSCKGIYTMEAELAFCMDDPLTVLKRSPAAPYVEPSVYRWACFNNGIPIPDVVREIYGDLDPDRNEFENPFDAMNPDGYLHWLRAAVSLRTKVQNLQYEVYLRRPDVQQAFPEPLINDQNGFLDWAGQFLDIEYGITPELTGYIPGSLQWALAPVHESTKLPTILYELYKSRPDLQQAFPDPCGEHTTTLLKWAQFRIPIEYSLNLEWLPTFSGIQTPVSPDFNALLQWALAPASAESSLPNLLYELHRIRPDLQSAFPDPLGVNQKDYLLWAQRFFHLLHPAENRINERFNLPGPTRTFFRHKAPVSGDAIGKRELGVNLIGYTRAENGVGEACRMAAGSLTAADIPFGMIPVPLSGAKSGDLFWGHKEMPDCKYNTNVMYINADSITGIYDRLGWNCFKDSYNIALWHWELARFPQKWNRSFEMLDEIWAPSTFVQKAIEEISPVPVIRIPHAVHVECAQELGRSYFGLPEDRFLFLSMYDTWSFQERKNPEASIEAFRRAFPLNDIRTALVIKVNHANSMPEQIQRLKQSLSSFGNVRLIEHTLSRVEINALLNCVDCFVSLHRSEGFGIVLAEAMYLGKPVIGTLWSGNTDFMNPANCCGVQYKLIELDRDHGPYEKGQYWADPDIDQAAHYMMKLVENEAWRRGIGARGQHTIRTEYSAQAIGQLMRKRLEKLNRI